MITGKISDKGQVVIPKEIRDRFQFHPGDTVIFQVVEGKVVIEKIEERLTDILRASKPVADSLKFQKRLRDEWD
ncbi:MAG: AbrB/MazE/SpoVT family DNA-binding domain-containing protein [Promethearchaeota archaeon]